MASWVMVPSESVRCHGEVTPLLVCLLLMTLAWSRKSAICSSVSLGSEGLSEAARTPAPRQHDNINTAIDRDRVRRSNMRKPPLEFYRCNAKDLYAQGGWVSRPKGFRYWLNSASTRLPDGIPECDNCKGDRAFTPIDATRRRFVRARSRLLTTPYCCSSRHPCSTRPPRARRIPRQPPVPGGRTSRRSGVLGNGWWDRTKQNRRG